MLGDTTTLSMEKSTRLGERVWFGSRRLLRRLAILVSDLDEDRRIFNEPSLGRLTEKCRAVGGDDEELMTEVGSVAEEGES